MRLGAEGPTSVAQVALIEEKIKEGSRAVVFEPDVDGEDATVRMTLIVGQFWIDTAKSLQAVAPIPSPS